MLTLLPGHASLGDLKRVWQTGSPIKLDPSCRAKVEAAATRVATAAAGSQAIYGVNTGFGKLASVKIPVEETRALQHNLVLSHCAGVGKATEGGIVRLMMILKLLSLGRGASGVRWRTITLMEAMLERGITPVVPGQGSVGASGDLAPLAHMAAVLIGEGTAEFQGKVLKGADALGQAGLEPVKLGAKEGLALINGTQFSTAYALAAVFEAEQLISASVVTGALTTDAIMGSTAPLQTEIHDLRGHPGQINVAAAQRRLLAGSEIRESHRDGDYRVQDPYCVRCQPQVIGAALDLLRQAASTLQIEANAVTDNPLVLTDPDRIVSGGNFHGEPVAFAADIIALALSEIGAIAQRRVALMVDPSLSFDLPAFLTPAPGLNSGFMIAEVTTAALMSENKHLANPCSTDSTPTSANQEDHVSMAAHGARRLMQMLENLSHILSVEALCAAQGIEFRAPLKTGIPLQRVMTFLRKRVPPLTHDRALTGDMETVSEMIRDGSLVRATDLSPLINLERFA